MAFSSYKTIGEVLKAFQVFYTEANFIGEAEFNVSDYFREDLETMMRDGVVDNSEVSICENRISDGNTEPLSITDFDMLYDQVEIREVFLDYPNIRVCSLPPG